MVYGGKGTFLSSLAELSFLTITSHHQSYNSLASLSLHHSGAVTRLVPAPAHHQLSNREHGTRITVQELFGNIPVRIKQRTIMYNNKEHDRDWELLNTKIVGLLLAWNRPLIFILGRPGSTNKLCFRLGEPLLNIPPHNLAFPRSLDLSLVCKILSQAKYIKPSSWSEWVEISIHTDSIAIQGAISLRPAPSKYVQFISIGIHYIHPELHNILYDLINQIFSGSDFGKEEDFTCCEESIGNLDASGRFEHIGAKNKQLRRGGKRADRWPMYFIHMDLQTRLKEGSRSAFDSLEMEHTFLNISNALEAMIFKFLSNHHFRPRKLQKRKFSLIAGLSNSDNLQNNSLSNGTHVTTLSSMGTHSSLTECGEKPLRPSLGTFSKLTHEGRAAVTEQALAHNITLPPSSSPDYSVRETFGHCTRMRSGRAGDQQEFTSRSRSEKSRNRPFQTSQLTETETASSTTNPNKKVNDTQNASCAISAKGEHPARINLASFDFNHNQELENPTITDHDRSVDDTLALTGSVSQASSLINARTDHGIARLSQGSPSDAGSYFQRKQNSDAVAVQDAYSHTSSVLFSTLKAGAWVTDFLKSWENPVFSYPRLRAPYPPKNDVDASHTFFTHQHSDLDIQKFVTEPTALFSATLSKKALRDAHVISQVDRKFILIRMRLYPREEPLDRGAFVSEQILVLVDQHAADERVRIEGLLSDLCTEPRQRDRVTLPCVHPISRIETTVLAGSIIFEIQEREYALFKTHAAHFANWGILYNLHMPNAEYVAETSPGYTLAIKTLPGGIAERCRTDAKALIELMRREVWRCEDCGNKEYNFFKTPHTSSRVTDTEPSTELGIDHWHRQITNCPQGILDLLTSRSCRSAIMFNDELMPEECLTLIARLATCIFPFQCAHGRPSMIPVMKLGQNFAQLDEDGAGATGEQDFGGDRMTERNFGQAWKRWKKQMAGNENEQIYQVKERSQN